MKKTPLCILATLPLAGCLSTVDLTADRMGTCTAPAANSNAFAKLASSPTATWNYAAPLSSRVLAGSRLPPITKKDIASGSTRLNKAGATIPIPQPGATGAAQQSVLPNAAHSVISTENDVSDEDLQHAQDARNQIRDLLGATPLSASEFAAQDNNKAALGSVGKSSASTVSKINKTLQAGGYDNLVNASANQLTSAATLSLSTPQKAYLSQELNTARFLATYYKAYFRGGHIFQISVDTKSLVDAGATSIEDRVDKALADAAGIKNLTADQSKAVSGVFNQLKTDLGGELAKVSANLCKEGANTSTGVCLLTQPLGNISFVSRAGITIQFVGESVTIGTNGKFTPSTTKISATVVAPQLAQVLWEGVFDSIPPYVPATANSTACVNKLYTGDLCVDKTTTKDVLDKISEVDADATSAETTTATITGYVIRGGWLFSLNNEAVAQAVETSAGEIARKTTEKLVWTHLSSDCASSTHPTVTTTKDY